MVYFPPEGKMIMMLKTESQGNTIDQDEAKQTAPQPFWLETFINGARYLFEAEI